LFFDELANLSFIDALARILSAAMDHIKKTTAFTDAIISKIIDVIISSAVLYFYIGPETPAINCESKLNSLLGKLSY
jgi:hypothetical protein